MLAASRFQVTDRRERLCSGVLLALATDLPQGLRELIHSDERMLDEVFQGVEVVLLEIASDLVIPGFPGDVPFLAKVLEGVLEPS
jgi:hypothetical protein